jgi:hypothetical protein
MTIVYLTPYINLTGIGDPAYNKHGGNDEVWGRCELTKPYTQYSDEFCHVSWCKTGWWAPNGTHKKKASACRAMDEYIIEEFTDTKFVFLTEEQWNKMQVLV